MNYSARLFFGLLLAAGCQSDPKPRAVLPPAATNKPAPVPPGTAGVPEPLFMSKVRRLRLFNKTLIMYIKSIVTLTLLMGSAILAAQQFVVSFSCDTCLAPFTGEVVIYTSKTDKVPRLSNNWTKAEPLIRAKVKALKPGDTFIICDKNCESYPVPPSGWERNGFFVQAVFDRNDRGERPMGNSTGNHFSNSQWVVFDQKKKKIALRCDQTVAYQPFVNTLYSREIRIRSKLLSDFHDRDVFIAGAIGLPADWVADSSQKLRLYVSITGFGGDYKADSGWNEPVWPGGEIQAILLNLDGNCPTGHSVYANSDVNGPWGDALVQELIPEVERLYHCNGFRYVTGHSSGGWASLWLQTHYPDFFHGCWSSSPDAFDFRDFQTINLYADTSAYYRKDGSLIPSVLLGGFQPVLTLRDECQREYLLRGQQYHCYSTVYGKIEPDGTVRDAYNFQTGKINSAVVADWKRYDISLYLRDNWSTLKPLLDGKIRLTTGEADNFLIDGPVAQLKKDLVDTLRADMDIQVLPGDHFTVFNDELWDNGTAHFYRCYDRWRISKNGFDWKKDLRPGDLLFQDLDCGPLCDAIEKVTEGAGGKDFSHVGMVVPSGDSLAVMEAIGGQVQRNGVGKFLKRSPKVAVGRLKPRWHKLALGATIAASAMLGVPYDDAFLPDNGRLYCSELVALAYQAANKGQPFFISPPMTFIDPDTGDFFPAWTDYYRDLNLDIPEGIPGCNPGGLSRDKKMSIIWQNQ